MKQILFLLAFVSLTWSRISVEILPQPVEKGKVFTFALVIPLRELPRTYEFPELAGVSKNFDFSSTELKYLLWVCAGLSVNLLFIIYSQSRSINLHV